MRDATGKTPARVHHAPAVAVHRPGDGEAGAHGSAATALREEALQQIDHAALPLVQVARVLAEFHRAVRVDGTGEREARRLVTAAGVAEQRRLGDPLRLEPAQPGADLVDGPGERLGVIEPPSPTYTPFTYAATLESGSRM